MKVIYIAGTSHSGSTLLDLMLNAHPEIASVGEVVSLSRQLAYKNPRKKLYARCSCGAPSLWQCDFWSRVNEITLQREGKALSELDVQDYGLANKKRSPNVVLFKAIFEASGKHFVVDSSKSPLRLAYLLQQSALEVYPVHVIRPPEGQIYSVARKHGGFFKHIFRYELVHHQIRRQLACIQHAVVPYEDLVLKPETTLDSVLKPLGLRFHPQQLCWAEAIKHNIAGNRVRRKSKSQLVLDEEWKNNLNFFQKWAINFGTAHSRRVNRTWLEPSANNISS
jgi:hypothetical protein